MDEKKNTIYTYEEAFEASKKYFEGDELAAKVFVDKYALRNVEGGLLELTPYETHKRLSKEFARIEKKYVNPLSENEIFNFFDKFIYGSPGGSPISAIGNPYQIQVSGNCFLIEAPYDSYGGILYSDQEFIQLAKRRAGVGITLDNLRPANLPVKNAARTTDGIGLWMERYSNSCREVAQHNRRGASIQCLSVHHPDIIEFIERKKDKTKVTGSNISVLITDEFMEALKNKTDYELRWPIESKKPEISRVESAQKIWNLIIEGNWQGGEPGILFISTARKNSVSHFYGELDSRFFDSGSNPCGEIIMGGPDSCRLMSLNLVSYVKNPFTKKSYFDFNLFKEKVIIAQRLMDDMVDLELELIQKVINKVNSDPEPKNIKKIEKDLWLKIKETCTKGRRTGLGITGLGDVFAYLGARYGSKKSIKITEEIYKTLCIESYRSSITMAKERGPFPLFSFDIEKNINFLKKIWEEDPSLYKDYLKYGRRNIANTTTAPNGSLSLLTKTTSGIEPVFNLSYTRRKKIHSDSKNDVVDFIDSLGDKWQEFKVDHYGFKKWKEITGKTEVKDSPYYCSTINDIDWKGSIEIQSVAQKWVCHSISKTHNTPKETTKEVISEIFMEAYKKELKGITVYRQGSRTGVLLDSTGPSITKTIAPKRPEVLNCDVHHVSVKKIPYFVIVSFLNKDVYEVFAGVNVLEDGEIVIPRNIDKGSIKKMKRGRYDLYDINRKETIRINISKFIDEEHETITRLISSNLRHGCDVNFVVHQLEKTTGDLMSFSKAICRVLKKYLEENSAVHGEECPECGGELRRVEGCISCSSCGFSKC